MKIKPYVFFSFRLLFVILSIVPNLIYSSEKPKFVNYEKDYFSKCKLMINFVDSLPEGQFVFSDSSGKPRIIGSFRSGKMDSTWLFYSANANKNMEINYSSGSLDGDIKMWYAMTTIPKLSGKFKNGIFDGEVKTFYTNNRKRVNRFYKNGFVDSAVAWSEYPFSPKMSKNDAKRLAQKDHNADFELISSQETLVRKILRYFNNGTIKSP